MKNENLVIFDIDGTLTQTVHFDSEAFSKAFIECLNLNEINTNWHEYRYSTDSGFTLELFQKHINRPPSSAELKDLQQKFFSLLEEMMIKNPDCCRPVLGADLLFSKIQNIGNWDIAIATGAWQTSAIMKLTHANLPFKNIPLASSDDHIERSEIINIVINRSKAHYKNAYYKNIIYVGDRMWDYRAATHLGLNFIGIGEELANAKITALTITDYLSNHFLNYLKEISL